MEIDDIVSLLKRALTDEEQGLGKGKIQVEDEVLEFVVESTNGEIRSSLNILEMAVYATAHSEDETYHVTLETVKEFTENKGFNHDKGGDSHYNVLSAFQNYIHEIL